MGSQKRERLEVIFDILKIIKNNNNSIKPTPLLRYSNLSFNNYKEYHQELLSKKFIEEETNKKGRKTIKLTNKGFDFLYEYKTIKSFISKFDLD